MVLASKVLPTPGLPYIRTREPLLNKPLNNSSRPPTPNLNVLITKHRIRELRKTNKSYCEDLIKSKTLPTNKNNYKLQYTPIIGVVVSNSEVVKRIFIELLEKDVEFRYAVVGYLGISEVLRSIEKLWENQNRLWEEVKALREGQSKLWEEVRGLREETRKLWENQNKLWEEVRRLWEEVRGLREDFRSLERRVRRLESGMSSLARAVGTTLDHYTATFIEELLRSLGVPEEKIDVRANIVLRNPEGVEREVDILNRDPLVVGEVTTYIDSIERVEEELSKVLDDVKFVESMFGSKVYMAVLAVENVSKEVVKYLEERCRRYNIKLIYGREISRLDRLD